MPQNASWCSARKTPVAGGHDTAIEQFGLVSDAHAGHWHRQVSFLAAESIQTAQNRGLNVHEGIFGVVLKSGDVHAGDNIRVIKLGDGTCSFTPAQALNEVGQARRNGTL